MQRLPTSALEPRLLAQCAVSGGRFELLEWHWPDMIDFTKAEDSLMVEMSLPPLSADASASFPDIAPDRYSYMGTLFIRFPGVQIRGRGEGGHIRVIRCILPDTLAAGQLPQRPGEALTFLQSLLNIRNETLRSIMTMALKEMTDGSSQSSDALDALYRLVMIEVKRLFASRLVQHAAGRLAPWQYQKIRDRLAVPGDRPDVRDLARLCGISVRHLQRQFVALTGQTLASYIDHHQIQLAKTLLQETDTPIQEVAALCSYRHANSFARAFRRATGRSPLDFRRRTQPPAKTLSPCRIRSKL